MKRRLVAICLQVWLLSATALAVGVPAYADAASSAEQEIIQYLSPAVHTLTKPVYVWSWFNANGRDPIWKTAVSSSSSVGYDHFVDTTNQFLEGYCPRDGSIPSPADCPDPSEVIKELSYATNDVYGPGLYTATDPVASMTFGGVSDWVLLQIQMPVGFRVLNTAELGNVQYSNLRDALKTLSCDAPELLSSTVPDILFRLSSPSAVPNVNSKCLAEFRKIYKDKLNLGGFTYAYASSEFKECDDVGQSANAAGGQSDYVSSNNTLRNVAVVFVNPGAIGAGDVKVFNAHTTDGFEDRQRIQSLFYKADIGDLASDAFMYYLNLQKKSGVPELQDKRLSSCQVICNLVNGSNGSNCKLSLYVCDNNDDCTFADPPKSVALPAYPTTMPTVMRSVNPPSTQISQFYDFGLPSPLPSGQLLWPDLDGKPPTPGLSSWVKQNILGCGSSYPF